MLSTPAREFPEFPAALAFLPVLTPDEARAALSERVIALEARLSAVDSDLKEGAKFLPRLFLVESEYERAIVATELGCVRGLVKDLRAGKLAWPSTEPDPSAP